MKVLFLSHFFPNRLEPLKGVFIYDKAKALACIVDLEVVVPVAYFPVVRPFVLNVFDNFNGLQINYLKYFGLPRFLFWLKWKPYYSAVNKFLENQVEDYDLINVEWVYPDCYAAAKIAKKMHKKLVVTIHGNECLGYFEPYFYRKMFINAVSLANHVVAVSQDMKRKLVLAYGISETKISVVPNGVFTNNFMPMDKELVRNRLKINSLNTNIFVCVARLAQEKSLHTLIAAFSLCGEQNRLYILGDGPLRRNLSLQIKKMKMAHRIFLVGAVPHDDVVFWLNAADFFCLSSVREGCPVVIHEALACGLPIISTSVGGIPDIINDNKYGLLCEPNSPVKLAQQLKKAVNISWDRQAIAKYGLSFTWERVGAEMLKIYRKV